MYLFNKPVAAVCLAVPSACAQAQQATYDFDIPAQPLGEVLDALARKTGLQPFFAENTVKGRFSPREALDKALAGTGLTYQFTDDKAAAPIGTTGYPDTVLAEVVVTATTRTANPLSKVPAGLIPCAAGGAQRHRHPPPP
jgi:type II secretory pathway component GspD/PulD (secretin)